MLDIVFLVLHIILSKQIVYFSRQIVYNSTLNAVLLLIFNHSLTAAGFSLSVCLDFLKVGTSLPWQFSYSLNFFSDST